MRENATVICWGKRQPASLGALDAPPETTFTQISAGLNFTCGLRQDAAIACWGDSAYGQASPPQGSFTEIAAGLLHACAVPTSQGSRPKLLCWGERFPNGAETLPLDSPLSHIQSGYGFTCGLTPQADIACLSINSRLAEITPGPFIRLGVGERHICALREDGSAHCQGNNNSYQASPPPTKFTQIAAGKNHSCGITRASLIECWGSGRAGAPGKRLAAPDGEFAAIFIGNRTSCALRQNGLPACWHTPAYLPLTPDYILPHDVSLAFGGAKFNSPVDIFPWPSGGLAIVEREGVITVRHDLPDAPQPQTILDLTAATVCCRLENGMLSAALDPQFQDFPFLYVWYITTAEADNVLGEGASGYGRFQVGRLARFRVERGVALKNSEMPILEVPLPNGWHLGGAVRFGADGMLYLGIGENAMPDNAQALNDLRGKIIRIDIRGANAERPYRIPPDNPFAHNPRARPEIWAYGMRNPWRMAFNPANPGSLFVADVGQTTREEVSIATAGANLGWPLCEGDICHDNADLAALVPPAVAYDRDVGCAVIGGVTVPWLNDKFIFGDLCARRVWMLAGDQASGWQMREIAELSEFARNILAFGAGENGGMYILSYDNPILRLDLRLADTLLDE